jgi:hypothetical protein
MELMSHYFYGYAMTKTKAYRDLTPLQVWVFIYANLKLIWLKFLIIWRFFRLWALADGSAATAHLAHSIFFRYRDTREYESLHQQQLHCKWVLESLAPSFQPLVGPIYLHSLWRQKL